jgi:hypothetical protein
MDGWVIPSAIIAAYEGGALAMMFYRWLASGEEFNRRKFLATFIVTLYVSANGLVAILARQPEIDSIGLIAFCIMAIQAGWGTVYGFREGAKALGK